ncbi:MAG TPA: FAD-dependent oxidoreductase [Clostridia bacterium]
MDGPGVDRRGKKQVCIIGAGITGMTAAYRLVRAGYAVTVVEQNPDPGGMLSSFKMGGTRLEHLYHHIFTSDTHVLALAGELGLLSDIHWHDAHDALYGGGRLYPFSSPLDLLRCRLVPLPDRIRTGLAVLQAGTLHDFEAIEEQTTAEWLRRKGGKKAYEAIWKPLLRSKFESDADDVSAVWIWNKFKLRGGSRKKSAGKETLGYMDGSFGRLIDRLGEEIASCGGSILTRTTALDISRRDGGGYAVTCILEDCTARTLPCDAVIACIAGRQFTNIIGALRFPVDYLSRVASVMHKANICLVLRMRYSLSSYYWTTICDDLPFIVMIEHTNLTGPEPYHGPVLYLSRYLSTTNPLWTCNDDEVFRLFCGAMSRIAPEFCAEDVIEWRVKRTRYAQPVIPRRYSKTMAPINTPDPGIMLAGLAQIYPEDRGVNYAIRLADQAAAAVEAFLEKENNAD